MAVSLPRLNGATNISADFAKINQGFNITESELNAQDARINNIVGQSGNSNTEIVDARGNFNVLSGRLNDVDSKLHNIFDVQRNMSSTGYQVLPSGLIFQWGAILVPSGTIKTVTLPITFPNAGLQAFAIIEHAAPVAISSSGLSQAILNLVQTSGSELPARWFAIGW